MMIKKLLPILLLLVGSGVGVGAGIFLRPPPEPPTEEEIALAEEQKADEAEAELNQAEETLPEGRAYVKMSNQFVVPVVDDGTIRSLVVMSLSLEVEANEQENIYSHEPKLRDVFLQVLFDHANVGGFDGAFTNANNMAVLRTALHEIARKTIGDAVTDVLIQEIARQDY